MLSLDWMRSRLALCGAALLLLAGCQTGSAFRDPAARLNPDMRMVADAYVGLGARPVSQLPVDQARSQPTLDDATRKVLEDQGKPSSTPPMRTVELTIPGATVPLAARLYDPSPGHPHQPILVYFHGGGGVLGTIDTADSAARALATQSHAMVLSVDYRRAPEAPFPAGLDDGVAAYRWVLANAASLGADPRRVAVGGESAGATIALATSVAARNAHLKLPVHELLIEPIAGADTQTRAMIANQRTVPLSRADMIWYLNTWIPNPADLDDPRISLIDRADLHGLPPTTLISSEMDPLESDGTTLTMKLQASGVDVTRTEYEGTAHGFFGMGTVVARAKEAERFAAAELDATFNRIGDPPQAPLHPRRPRHRTARRR